MAHARVALESDARTGKRLASGHERKCSFLVRKSIDSLPTGPVSAEHLALAQHSHSYWTTGSPSHAPEDRQVLRVASPSAVSARSMSSLHGGSTDLLCLVAENKPCAQARHTRETPLADQRSQARNSPALAEPAYNNLVSQGYRRPSLPGLSHPRRPTERRRPCSSSYVVESVRLCSCDKSNHAGMLMPE